MTDSDIENKIRELIAKQLDLPISRVTDDKKFIEDKPLASVGYGFDQTHQILLAFPKVEVGAKIYLKYTKATLKAPLDNFFDI